MFTLKIISMLVSIDDCTAIADLCKRRAFPVDCAYQGFGSGEEDSWAQSFFKNLDLYSGYDTGFATLGLLERKADMPFNLANGHQNMASSQGG
jgi:hypothetical protein